MCINAPRKVIRVTGNTAFMEDGRVVRLGWLDGIAVGDYLEVYGDIALSKVASHEAKTIQTARMSKGV